MLVVNPTADVDPVISRVEKSIKDASATGLKINKLGKKPLSYQIAKHSEGEYVLFDFEAGGEAVGAVSKRLRLEQEAILRYLIIKTKASRVSKISEIKDTRQKEEPSKVTVKTISSKEKKEKVSQRKVSTAKGEFRSKERKVPKVSKAKSTKGKGK